MDRDTFVTAGAQSPPVTRRSARGWISLASGAPAFALMSGVLLLHWTPTPLLTNALIAVSIALALITPDSRPALLGFALASTAFLAELFLILLHAVGR